MNQKYLTNNERKYPILTDISVPYVGIDSLFQQNKKNTI